MNLKDKFGTWTLPTETIKQVADQPELVVDVVRRPSMGTQLEQRLANLNHQEKRFVSRLVGEFEQGELSALKQLSAERQIAIIDTAINYIQYRRHLGKEDAAYNKGKLHALLVQRSQLPANDGSVQWQEISDSISPDQGHDSMRFEISGGNFRVEDNDIMLNDESFVELSIQPGFHDLLSSEAGHAPNSQINFLKLQGRYQPDSKEWQLHSFTLIDIVSLSPLGAFIKEPSWKVNFGWELNLDNECAECTPFIVNPGVGLSVQSSINLREVYFAFLEARFEYDQQFDSDHRTGFGATFGLLFDVTEQWRLALSVNRTRYSAGQRSHVSDIEFRQRYYLSPNSEIVLNFKTVGTHREGKLGVAYYF